MQTFTVRDLRERTGELIRGAEDGELSIVTKHGTPVFIAVPFDEKVLHKGVLAALAVKLFDDEAITLRQAAKIAGMLLGEFMEFCSAQGVSVVRLSADELEAELAHVEELARR
ncbi:conserved hypothetical protein [Candidatus Accumulibacter aalborgensis]|uniref:Prevent-host-death family protein n=1 Tax=Candidatus Accumulibacter aalborgensis TaxID=1860102 RepID=A0A1A8XX89_9PROT|nr:type II toxin-antitoxin system prevent-host-death family antitoxin [Candidatus Accumulibacter aalborgensis]SBT08643.1 conserved hypothetical protein [Candidatus Accumulibacter aalborgensis]